MLAKCCESLLMLDAFGRIPQFYYKGSRYQQTKLGFLMTLFLVLFGVGCIVYFGGDVFNRKNPEVISSDQFTPIPEPLVIDPKLRPFMMEINDPSGTVYYTDLSLIRPQVRQLTLIKGNNTTNYTEESYDMEICTDSHFSQLIDVDKEAYSYFMKFNLSRFFCVPKSVKSLMVEGTFDSDIFKVVKFTFEFCNNITSNICRPNDEIRKTLGKGYMGLYFKDYKSDPGNHNNPWKSAPHELFTNYLPNSRKNVDIFMKNNVIITDDGALFENFRFENFHNFQEQRESYFLEDSVELISMTLKLRQEYVAINRKYKKLQDLLAYISGFVNVCWICSYIVCYLYTYVSFFVELINDIFTIKYVSEDDDEQNSKEHHTGNEGEIVIKRSLESLPPKKLSLDSPNIKKIEMVNHSLFCKDAMKKTKLEDNPLFEKPDNQTPAFELGRKLDAGDSFIKMEEPNINEIKIGSISAIRGGPSIIKHEPCKPCEDVSEPDVDSIDTKLRQEQKQSSFVTLRAKNLVFNLDENEISPKRNPKKNNTYQFESHFERVTNLPNIKSENSPEKKSLHKKVKENYKIKKMQIGLWDMWYYYTSCCGNKRIRKNNYVFERLKDILTQQLDIRLFVERIYDFEKLKMLLLSQSELESFDKLPKPEIVIRDCENEKKKPINFQVSLLNRKIDEKRGLRERLSFLMDSAFTTIFHKGKNTFFSKKQRTNEV